MVWAIMFKRADIVGTHVSMPSWPVWHGICHDTTNFVRKLGKLIFEYTEAAGIQENMFVKGVP